MKNIKRNPKMPIRLTIFAGSLSMAAKKNGGTAQNSRATSFTRGGGHAPSELNNGRLSSEMPSNPFHVLGDMLPMMLFAKAWAFMG